MKRSPWFLAAILWFALLAACQSKSPVAAPLTSSTAQSPGHEAAEPTTNATEAPTAAAASVEPPASMQQEPLEPTSTTSVPPAGWNEPPTIRAKLSRDPVSNGEKQTRDLLTTTASPRRDDVMLAVAYKGVTVPLDQAVPATVEPLKSGIRQQLYIRQVETNTNRQIEAVLMAVSDHAYFWFDTTPGLEPPSSELIDANSSAFDQIYEQVVDIFGSEDNPGVDGDFRIHIVNVSPLTLCDVSEENRSQCRFRGFVSARDALPSYVDEFSNAREMLVMNGYYFDQPAYLPVLVHEFRHLVGANYDRSDQDWEIEGSASLASDLLGYDGDVVRRANLFLKNPDQQLNSWTDQNTTPFYGQGYLFNRYLFDRLGPESYRQYAVHPDSGLRALDQVTADIELPFNGQDLWLDWQAALALIGEQAVPAKYSLPQGLTPVSMTEIGLSTGQFVTTVHQFAADYYQIESDEPVTLDFTGSSHARLMPIVPFAGERMWLSDRANYSSTSLTREFDLSRVSQAALSYQVYHDIERGYDFAYLTLSDDGGTTWEPLSAGHMRGPETIDNPAYLALTPDFYTGQSGQWLAESVDLTPFTGQVVLVRFEYVTDPILTASGLALDNIAVPEIGFYDGAEQDLGWDAAGFVRATGYVPQKWHLQLVTFSNGVPLVTPVILTDSNSTEIRVEPLDADQPSILVVAASAPVTLEPAYYSIELR